MHKYPYNWENGLENIGKYNFKEAMKEDWYMTKKSIEEGIWNAVEDTFLGVFAIVAVPTIVSLASWDLWKRSRSEKQKNKVERVK